MAFPRKNLSEDEQIVLDLRPHWITMFIPTSLLFAMFVAGLFFRFRVDNSFARPVVGVFLLAAVVYFIVRFLVWNSINFVVTTDRVIYKNGVISKSSVEMPLERINTVSSEQSALERLVGAGDLAIEAASESGKHEIENLPAPDKIQNIIYQEMEDNENRKFDRGSKTSAPAEVTIPQKIDQLDELRRKGIISDAEFEAKKTDLLKRM